MVKDKRLRGIFVLALDEAPSSVPVDRAMPFAWRMKRTRTVARTREKHLFSWKEGRRRRRDWRRDEGQAGRREGWPNVIEQKRRNFCEPGGRPGGSVGDRRYG